MLGGRAAPCRRRQPLAAALLAAALLAAALCVAAVFAAAIARGLCVAAFASSAALCAAAAIARNVYVARPTAYGTPASVESSTAATDGPDEGLNE